MIEKSHPQGRAGDSSYFAKPPLYLIDNLHQFLVQGTVS